MATTNSTHPLFARYPLTERPISTGLVPAPYHVYDGRGMLIGGTLPHDVADGWLNGQAYTPVVDSAGRALAGIWVCDFTEASLGPHRELQYFVAATRRGLPAITAPDHPLALLRALLVEPHVALFCKRLWNDSKTVVAYNRELLGLDARLCRGEVAAKDDRLWYSFRERDDRVILEGAVRLRSASSPGVLVDMLRAFGLKASREAAGREAIETRIVNPIGITFADNYEAKAVLAADKLVVQRWESSDVLTFGPAGEMAGFVPTFIEHMTPYRFVYLEPQTSIP